MEYLKSVIGSQKTEEGSDYSYAETIERLVERLDSSTLLDDRRDSCRALKSLSFKHRVEVGAQGLSSLCRVLETDFNDAEIVSYALETIINITSPKRCLDDEVPYESNKVESSESVGEQFTEIFLKSVDNVTLILNCLDEYNFKIRWPAVKLLNNLVCNKPRDIQETILISPMGVSKMIDLLSDSRDVIRNDALLLLIQLTKGNANIQKIVAFENTFDRLFDIMSEEGYIDGGIIAEDCLLLMQNLLKNNASNQNFFKEGSYIQRLSPLFVLNEFDWTPPKERVIFSGLAVIRALVSPTNPSQAISSCQRALEKSGIFKNLCDILMRNEIPAALLAETINTVAEIMRGNLSNQEAFSKVRSSCSPPREVLVLLLMSMLNEKQPILLRCSVLYCFQCFLFKNQTAQAGIVRTLLPSADYDDTSVTSGQLICAGLYSRDTLSNWFSTVALSHCLIDNPAQKELALNVMLTPSPEQQPLHLLHQVVHLLTQSKHIQSKVGLLILLATWLSHCPLAVTQFLSIDFGVAFLISQAAASEHDENEELVQGLCAFLMGICVLFNDGQSNAFSKQSLKHLIANRVGIETFAEKLNEVSRHEVYSQASKRPQLVETPKTLLLDHEFCKLFRMLEGMIVKKIYQEAEESGFHVVNVSNGCNETDSYYERDQRALLDERDERIRQLSEENERLVAEIQTYRASVEYLENCNAELRDQNTQLIAREEMLRNELDRQNISLSSAKFATSSDISEVEALKKELNESKLLVERLKGESDQMKNDQEDLLILLSDQEEKIKELESRLSCEQRMDDQLLAMPGDILTADCSNDYPTTDGKFTDDIV